MAKVDLNAIKPSKQYLEELAKQEAIKESTKAPTKGIVDADNIVSFKKPTSKKIAEKFGISDFRDIASYAFTDMIVPGVKEFILDGISLMFFNEVRDRSRSRSHYDRDDRDYGRVHYGGYFRSSRDRDRDDRRRRDYRDSKYYEDDRDVDYRNLIVKYKEDADKIIGTMYYILDEDKAVTVAQLLDMMNIASRPIDNDWGWTDKRQIRKTRVRNGWLIDVPEAEEL